MGGSGEPEVMSATVCHLRENGGRERGCERVPKTAINRREVYAKRGGIRRPPKEPLEPYHKTGAV